jgi:cytochrome P450 family 142 subfamily A polypeptide 1
MASHPTHPEIDLLAGEFYADDPHRHWTWMRENAPVYHDAKNDVWALTRYADVLAASKDTTSFSNARNGNRPHGLPLPMMIHMDDPAHLQRRKLVNRGFTPRRVRDNEVEVREICDGIIDRVCERGECDFVWDIAAPLPLILIGNMLGFEQSSYDDLLRWSDDMLKGTTSNNPSAALKAREAGMAFREYQMAVIEERRSNGLRDDLVSVLMQAEVDGQGLDDESLVMETLLILIGGDETTRHVITGGMHALLSHPEQRRKLSGAFDQHIETAIEEMLRWVTPIKNMNRAVTRDVEFSGHVLHEGDQVLLMYESANRDESVFPDPFAFDIARDPNHHLAFGFGAHFCLGNALARVELKVMFERLLARLPDLELATTDPLPLRPSNFIVGFEEMPVRFTPSVKIGRAG